MTEVEESKKEYYYSLKNFVNSKQFNSFITIVILIQAGVLALETFPQFSQYHEIFEHVHVLVVVIFIVEAILKISSLYPEPQRYFKDGWNIVDFGIIILSLIPFTGSFSTVARLVRLLRITRLTNRSKEMRVMIGTIIKSLPSLLNIFLILCMLFFIYSIAGYHLFKNVDPEHWNSLPTASLTLFKVLTVEGWIEIMDNVIKANIFYVFFFISFIVISTFIVTNIFVAIIVNKSEEAHRQLQREILKSITREEILEEIRELKQIMSDLEKRLATFQDKK